MVSILLKDSQLVREQSISEYELRSFESTATFPLQSLGIQTSPPPSTTFSRCVGLYKIYQAYKVDYQKILEQEMEMEKKEKEKDRGATKPKPVSDE